MIGKKRKCLRRLTLSTCFILMMSILLSVDAKEMKQENSWRYENGKPITEKSRASALTVDNAWGETDGKFINDKGDIIQGAIRKGIDVSEWQGTIDWESVKSTDVDFAIIRCGYGLNQTDQDDEQWERNADECTRLGIPFGTYLYSYATSVEEAKSEAEHVLRLVEGYKLDYPIYYDMEDNSTIGVGKNNLAQIAKTFCDTIEAAGYEVGVYANKYWWTTYLTDPVFDQWDKWVAQYNSVCDYMGDYRIWQCTSSGKIDGISGNTDINFEFNKWSAQTINTDLVAPQAYNKDILLTADILGNTSDLQYKFVWMKDSWSEWGVIQEFSGNNSAVWHPIKGGQYKIYMDVKDSSGNQETVFISYQVQNWCHAGITSDLSSPQLKNQKIILNASAAGYTEGLKYKFVWMKNDWEEWGVIQNLSEINSAEWEPMTAGEYYIYVDIEDSEGITDTRIICFNILEKSWVISELEISATNGEIEAGKELKIEPHLETLIEGAKDEDKVYKYVWMKNDWEEWDVIRDFSSNIKITWTPDNIGEYVLCVDVKDKAGNVESRQVTVEVVPPTWTFEEISVSIPSPQLIDTSIEILPQIKGNAYGLKYKYVWMKNDWQSWGVIKEFSQTPSGEWKPDEIGRYQLYVDIQDMSGHITTKTLSYEILKKSWALSDIQIFAREGEPEIGKELTIIPQIDQLVQDLSDTTKAYKYVWMRNNWSEWGVIQNFSSNESMTWIPRDYGIYTLCVDVKDEQGNIESARVNVEVGEPKWNWNSIVTSVNSPQILNMEIKLSPQIDGNTYGLTYKYVWMKNNWSEWGIIKDFSESDSVVWKPMEPGEYQLYVDIKDNKGDITTKTLPYTILKKGWTFENIEVLVQEGSIEVGKELQIVPHIKQLVEGVPEEQKLYKYVWMKNGWSEWEVIQDFSVSKTIPWVPEDSGEYFLYVDVKDKAGNVESLSTSVHVLETKKSSYEKPSMN